VAASLVLGHAKVKENRGGERKLIEIRNYSCKVRIPPTSR
jgi:hypothetical protein